MKRVSAYFANDRLLTCLVALLAGLICRNVVADSCSVESSVSPSPAIPTVFWQDLAKFGFLIARDSSGEAINMQLNRRMQTFASYAQLRSEAFNWGQSTYQSVRNRVTDMRGSSDLVSVLSGLCRDFDQASFGEITLNSSTWMSRLTTAKYRLQRVSNDANALLGQLQLYAELMSAARSHYDRGGYSINPDMQIGPTPTKLSDQLNNLSAVWRALSKDLAHAVTLLPDNIDLNRESDIINLSSAATLLNNSIQRVALLTGNAVDVTRLTSGDYLYDQCPIKENKSYMIGNAWFEKINGVLEGLPSEKTVKVARRADLSSNPVTQILLYNAQHWQFHKAGRGYWTMTNNFSTGMSLLLDVSNERRKESTPMFSPSNYGAAQYTGQFWRCYPTRWPGRYRLSNSFQGEGYSLDVYNNSKRHTFMGDTGAFGGQLWSITEVR